jgi:hypothetical protein
VQIRLSAPSTPTLCMDHGFRVSSRALGASLSLASVAGAGFRALLPLLRRVPIMTAIAGGTYVGGIITTLALLHPLEYVAMNSLAGGTRGAKFRTGLLVGSGVGRVASSRTPFPLR